jgi:hypothetical protein
MASQFNFDFNSTPSNINRTSSLSSGFPGASQQLLHNQYGSTGSQPVTPGPVRCEYHFLGATTSKLWADVSPLSAERVTLLPESHHRAPQTPLPHRGNHREYHSVPFFEHIGLKAMHWCRLVGSEDLNMPPTSAQRQTRAFSPPTPPIMDPDSPLQDRLLSHRDTEPEVHPRFIEEVGRSMGFVEADDEYRNSLHTIPKVSLFYSCTISARTNMCQMGRGTPRGQMQTNIFQVGLLFAILKECRANAEAIQALRTMTSDLHARLEESFTLTMEHKVSDWSIT